ncbi:MAG: helix-turn-helix domain-containing protein [Clostridia bacterium]|nr:helix-turn-helix domain-containing protein [Clostridia bacterium]
MNTYVTAEIIKQLREKKGLTQSGLAKIIGVSDKAISKWETGKGLPDISLIEPLSAALSVSVAELLSGECIKNENKSGNMKKSNFFVCPVCSNIIHSVGKNLNSCCGINLPPLEVEEENERHTITVENIGSEIFVTVNHEMTKTHYISFIAYVTSDRCELVKLYPEQDAAVYFTKRGGGTIYAYCNNDGLFKKELQ